MTASDCELADSLAQPEHRALLLALECIGWLHMTGKAHPDFLRSHGGITVNYNQKRWHSDLPDSWDSYWKCIGDYDVFKLPDRWQSFLSDFDEPKSKASAVGLLQAAHGMASGIEKNVPNAPSRYLGQDANHLWLSSAFGCPERNLLADPPRWLHEGGWESLLRHISSMLDELERLGRDANATCDAWHEWREKAIGPDGWLPKPFRSTLAETRLPNNDVTLWDQSYVAAAMFKSAAAGAVLCGTSFQWDKQLKQQTRWRLLTIGIGAEHYEQRAVRVGDWQGARLQLDDFFRRVRKLVEVELPLGSQIYYDGQVAVFTFPGRHQDGKGQENNGITQDNARKLRDTIGENVDEIARDLELETPPYCQISESTRSLVGLSSEVNKASEWLAVPLHRDWLPKKADKNPDEEEGAPSPSGHTCPVCGVRPNGTAEQTRAPKGQPCSVCGNRRKHRLRSWEDGHYNPDTIWFSEVADGNDRLALLTFSFDLAPWLGGDALDSLRAQAASEWVRHNSDVQNQGIRPEYAFQDLVDYTCTRIQETPDWNDPVLRLLQDGFQHEQGDSWKPFFCKIVEDRVAGTETPPRWDDLTPRQRAHWLIHQLLRKHASPGRTHRFWRTTEAFLDGLLVQFRELAAPPSNRWRGWRLEVTARVEEGEPLGKHNDGEVFNGHLRGQPMGLLYRHETGDFITVSNLARNLKATDRKETLREQQFEARGDHDERPRTFHIETVREPGDPLGVYTPVIPLDRSPERLRVLVPLEHAPDCLDAAVSAWKEQFARVWDRMPLYAGAVACPRTMPYQAVIEATRNLEDDLRGGPPEGAEETWRVKAAEFRDGTQSLQMTTTTPQEREEIVSIPLNLPDGRPDHFYPYCRVEDRTLRRRLDFLHPDGKTLYRHMGDLQRGDGVRVRPARFGWLFMDGAARRFEPVKPRPLADWQRMRHLWTLVRRNAPSLAAVQGAWATLDEEWHQWKGAPEAEAEWRELARALLNQRWSARGAALEELAEAAVSGELRQCLEWHLGVTKTPLKEKFDDQS